MIKLIALIGPSGSGKTETMNALIKNPLFIKLKSTTSKDDRLEDYVKVSREEFENMIKNNEFIDYTEYAGNYYGLTKDCLSNLNDQIGVKAFDYEGIKNLKKIFGADVLTVFLYRETEKLIATINERDVTDDEKEKRIKQLEHEQTNRFRPEIDIVFDIVEGDIEHTVSSIVSAIK